MTKILLVDNNAVERFINERKSDNALRSKNYNIVNDDQEALQFLSSLEKVRNFPDLIFLGFNSQKYKMSDFVKRFKKAGRRLRVNSRIIVMIDKPALAERKKVSNGVLYFLANTTEQNHILQSLTQ